MQPRRRASSSSDDDLNMSKVVEFDASVFDLSVNFSASPLKMSQQLQSPPTSRDGQQQHHEEVEDAGEEEASMLLPASSPTSSITSDKTTTTTDPPTTTSSDHHPRPSCRVSMLMILLVSAAAIAMVWIFQSTPQLACRGRRSASCESTPTKFIAEHATCFASLGLTDNERAIVHAVRNLGKPYSPALELFPSHNATTTPITSPSNLLAGLHYTSCGAGQSSTLLRQQQQQPPIQLVIVHSSNPGEQLELIASAFTRPRPPPHQLDAARVCAIFPFGTVERVMERLAAAAASNRSSSIVSMRRTKPHKFMLIIITQ